MKNLGFISIDNEKILILRFISLAAALIIAILLLSYSYLFLHTFQIYNNTTSYFPWSYHVNYQNLSAVMGLFYIGTGISVVLLWGFVMGFLFLLWPNRKLLVSLLKPRKEWLAKLKLAWHEEDKRQTTGREEAQAKEEGPKKGAAKINGEITEQDTRSNRWTGSIRSEPIPDPEEETPVVASQGANSSVLQQRQQQLLLQRRHQQQGKKGGNRRNRSALYDEYLDQDQVGAGAEMKRASITERFIQFAVWLTEVPTRYVSSKIPGLREDILKSNLNIAPEGIISLSILFTILSVPFVIAGDYLLATSGYPLEAVFLPVSLVLPMVIGLSMPKISASSRGAALDSELPYLIGYITVLAGGGISPFRTIKRIASADKIFPAGAKEARRIVLDIELFGLDPVTAFEKAALYAPNKRFSDFLGGYIAVLKTGGDVVSYLQSQLRDIYAYTEVKTKASSETIGTFAETYIIATVVLGVSLFIFFIAEALLTGASQGVNPLMIELFGIVFVPMISFTFILIVNSAQIKEPFTYYLPYYAFLASIPVGVLFYFLPVDLPVYIKLGVALALISAPGAILNHLYVSKKKAIEAKLSNFVRDIAEVRKTGLAPEKTIEQLAGRNYAGLTEHVKKISNQLGWGIPIRKVLQLFASQVKSWVTQAIAFLLLEVVDVGGGSPALFIGLADFTEKTNQLNRERRSQVRPYIIVPYIGAVLIVITTALMVYLLSGPGLSVSGTSGIGFIAPPSVIKQATTILFLAAFFQAWVMGIVAGKMGELTVADGFKHATIIVIICIIAVYVSELFVKF